MRWTFDDVLALTPKQADIMHRLISDELIERASFEARLHGAKPEQVERVESRKNDGDYKKIDTTVIDKHSSDTMDRLRRKAEGIKRGKDNPRS